MPRSTNKKSAEPWFSFIDNFERAFDDKISEIVMAFDRKIGHSGGGSMDVDADDEATFTSGLFTNVSAMDDETLRGMNYETVSVRTFARPPPTQQMLQLDTLQSYLPPAHIFSTGKDQVTTNKDKKNTSNQRWFKLFSSKIAETQEPAEEANMVVSMLQSSNHGLGFWNAEENSEGNGKAVFSSTQSKNPKDEHQISKSESLLRDGNAAPPMLMLPVNEYGFSYPFHQVNDTQSEVEDSVTPTNRNDSQINSRVESHNQCFDSQQTEDKKDGSTYRPSEKSKKRPFSWLFRRRKHRSSSIDQALVQPETIILHSEKEITQNAIVECTREDTATVDVPGYNPQSREERRDVPPLPQTLKPKGYSSIAIGCFDDLCESGVDSYACFDFHPPTLKQLKKKHEPCEYPLSTNAGKTQHKKLGSPKKLQLRRYEGYIVSGDLEMASLCVR